MVTLGTRKVSVERVAPAEPELEPRELTKISKLPFFKMGDRTVIVGRRLLGTVSETSP